MVALFRYYFFIIEILTLVDPTDLDLDSVLFPPVETGGYNIRSSLRLFVTKNNLFISINYL